MANTIKTNRSIRLNGINPLAYVGVNPYTPPDYVIYQRDPTPKDWQNFQVGAIWLNQQDPPTSPPVYKVWMLVSLYANVAKWIMFSSGTGSVISLSGNTGTNPVFADGAGNINVFGDGVDINISGDGVHTLTASLVNGHAITKLQASDGTQAVPVSGVVIFPDQVIAAGFGGAVPVNSNLFSNVNPNLGQNFTINLKPTIKLPATTVGGGTFIAGAIFLAGNPFMHGFGGTFLGNVAGNTTSTASLNVGIGNAVLNAITTGDNNIAVGSSTLDSCTIGANNTFIGTHGAIDLTTGIQNTGIGANAGGGIISGSYNTFLGKDAGLNYTGAESSNVLVGIVDGTVGESNVVRIGVQGTGNGEQNSCYLVGTTYITGDNGTGVATTVGLTNVGSTTISTGTGTVKMSSANNANNAAWIKIYFGTTAYWIPAWTTNSP